MSTERTAMPNPYLQPMRPGEIIVNTVRFYRDHLRLLVLVSLGPHLALLGLELLLLHAGQASPAAFAMVMLATVALNGVAMAALTVAIGRCTLGKEPSVAATYRQAVASGLPAVVLAYLFTALLVSLGMMLLVLPGVLLGALFAPAIPMIVIERRGALHGLIHSVMLMKEQLLKGIVVFSYFIGVAGILPLLLLVLQGDAALGPYSPLLSAIIGSITMPLGFTANVLLYFSLRATDEAAAAQLQAELEPPAVE